MRWYELAQNPKAITELYHEVPALEGVQLTELKLSGHGPTMSIRMGLPRFPDRVPRRWTYQGYNVVQLQLDFWSLKEMDIHLRGWWAYDPIDLSIEPTHNRVLRFSCISPHCSLEGYMYGFRITMHKFVLPDENKGGES